MGGPNDQYVVFDSNQIKSVNNKKPTADADIMYSKVAEGQLGLFDQPMPKPEPEPVALPKSQGEQISLFDQPKRPIIEAQVADTEPVNPYAPVDGKVTQAMYDRAEEIMRNYNKGIPENELYNQINPDTLPKGYAEVRDIVDNSIAPKVNKMSFDELLDEVWGDNNIAKENERYFRDEEITKANNKAKALGIAPPSDKYVTPTEAKLREKLLDKYKSDQKIKMNQAILNGDDDFIRPEVNDNIRNIIPGRDNFRKGFTAAADEVLSERLGIAPGNTPKMNGDYDDGGSYGRYSHVSGEPQGNIAIKKGLGRYPEDAVSVVAHERLHSFQNETNNARPGRYNKEVTDAYKELRKDLGDFYKSKDEIKRRFKKDTDYWADSGEQESRMLQQYLENRGYARSTINAAQRLQYGGTEWGNEINPAFDKFFDKLRALSKKGVALPALTALFGGGAIMAATQGDDKKKKSEVK
jgi:hypothetical protein